MTKGKNGIVIYEPPNGRIRADIETFALNIAQAATIRSEDPYVQVGACCLRHDNSIAGVGYNGAPAGIEIDWSDRDRRREKVIHAEINCLNYVRPGEGKLLAVTLSPCKDCLKMIAAKGIKKVVYGEVYDKDHGSFDLAEEFGIELVKGYI